jgi:ribosomal protein L16 Arg81 hydroxylase
MNQAIAPAWVAWITENLLAGAEPSELLATLTAHGVPLHLAEESIADIQQHPIFAGAHRATRAHRQLEMLPRLQAALDDAGQGGIERRPTPTAEAFFQRYYAPNQPVILTDFTATWSARTWTPESLVERLGAVDIGAALNREADPRYDMHTADHTEQMRLAEYVRRIRAVGRSNDLYMVANNRNMERPEFQVLFEDVRFDRGYLDARRTHGCVALWLGPAGTITPMHHDTCNIMFCQLYGRKHYRLYPPHTTELLEDAISMYAADPDATPASGRPREFVLEPGETLFIPIGWWHRVEALDVSVSIAFSNFTRPNLYSWFRPGAAR